MIQWIKNTGTKPDCKYVHIRLNIPDEITNDYKIYKYQPVDKWSWNLTKTGIIITDYVVAV